jgi:hypothetical protein
MRRLRLLVLTLVVGMLLATASAASAAPQREYYFPIECSGEVFMTAWTPGWGSWTLHMDNGSSFVAHRWVVRWDQRFPGADAETWLNRGHGAQMEYCTATCPEGTPIEIWGVRTPVRGR